MKTTTNTIQSYILPIEYPIINSNSEHGYLLSGLQTNSRAYEWIMNNYIHQVLYFKPQGCDMNFFPMSNHALCPCIDYQRISKKVVKNMWENPSEFFTEFINSNMYIYTHLNWYYMSSSDHFLQYHIMHPTIIYGYDKKEKIFFTGDFYKNKKFGFSKEKFENVNIAFKNNETQFKISFTNDRYNAAYDIVLYKNRKDFDYKFNTEVFAISLNDYIRSTNVSYSYGRGDYAFYDGQYKNYKTCFGIEIYDVLSEYLIKEPIKEINHKFFTVPLDRISLMIKRIDFLEQKNIIKEGKVLKEEFEYIHKMIHHNLLMSIKYNITCKNILKLKIGKSLLEIKKLELLSYKKLLNNIII